MKVEKWLNTEGGRKNQFCRFLTRALFCRFLGLVVFLPLKSLITIVQTDVLSSSLHNSLFHSSSKTFDLLAGFFLRNILLLRVYIKACMGTKNNKNHNNHNNNNKLFPNDI